MVKCLISCLVFSFQENLWNSLRSAWMRVVDLEFVEKKIIPRLEKFIPEMSRYALELDQNAVSNAAAEAAREEAKAKGEAGLTKPPSKPSTRPVSPKLTKTRPPAMPEPERIDGQITAKEVPGFINNTTLALLQQEKQEKKNKIKESTVAQYNKSLEYKFHTSKAGRTLEEVRQEVEAKRSEGLAFDSSFYNEPPDFKKNAPSVRLNASTILKEDALYRKQQAKDAEVLRNYEEELRDPYDYYMWQQDLRERDAIDKLKGVAMRREQAKLSAVEAKDAMARQKEDNFSVASLMREQAEVIRNQKELERELERLQHQEVVQSIIEVRSTKPQEATRKVLESKIGLGKTVREQLEEARLAKEEEDRKEEEIKADKIRQLRALNTVHKERIVVFDPTLTAGIGLLDEMSYMEMQVRQKQEKERAEEAERVKRAEIAEEKAKKSTVLDKRLDVIMRAREVKAQANQQARQRSKENKQREEEEQKKARAIAAAILDKELSAKREAHRAEQAALQAEQDRIKRQQQYLGAAMGQVEETRERELQLARERQAAQLARDYLAQSQGLQQSLSSDRANTNTLQKIQKRSKHAEAAERELLAQSEKRVSIDKIKARIVEKKSMFLTGQRQHETTHTVLVEHNPYAASISMESQTKARSQRLLLGSSSSQSHTRAPLGSTLDSTKQGKRVQMMA